MKLKKRLHLLLTICLTISMMTFGSFSASATTYFTDGNYQYTTIGKSSCITMVNNYISGDITIPSTLDGYAVGSIDCEAFSWCKKITSITIPNTVTSIFNYAFLNCTSLKSVTFGSNVTYIGSNIFLGCVSLSDIYYNGTLEEKNKIRITSDNEILNNAKWHFVICETNGHRYDGSCDEQCDICGETREVSHFWDSGKTTKKATCNQIGTKVFTCVVCGTTKDETLPEITEHTYGNWVEIKTVTCTENGSKKRTCTTCQDEESRDIVTNGHSLDGWVIVEEATCETKGKETRKCSKCYYEEKRDIEAKGHSYKNEWTIDSDATCTTTGSKSHHCSDCDSKIDLTNISPTGHNFGEWKTTKQPTTQKTGEAQRRCKNSGCSEIQTKTIAKLAADGHSHSFGDWKTEEEATCTKNGKSVEIVPYAWRKK